VLARGLEYICLRKIPLDSFLLEGHQDMGHRKVMTLNFSTDEKTVRVELSERGGSTGSERWAGIDLWITHDSWQQVIENLAKKIDEAEEAFHAITEMNKEADLADAKGVYFEWWRDAYQFKKNASLDLHQRS